jgi:hypothetical protein
MNITEDVKQCITKLKTFESSDQLFAEIIHARNFARLARQNSDYFLLLPYKKTSNRDAYLKHLEVRYGLECEVIEANKVSNETLTVIKLIKPTDKELDVFADLISLLLNRVSTNPEIHEIVELIELIIEIFNPGQNISDSEIVGLWGELFLIHISNNPTGLINCWRTNSSDRFDFSDQNSRIEVKTTRGLRQHTFSYEQVSPHNDLTIVIASLVLVEDQNGFSASDLLQQIEKRVTSQQAKRKLTSNTLRIIQGDLRSNQHLKFDMEIAGINLRYFTSNSIPQPLLPPLGVSEVKFTSDLQLTSNIDLQQIQIQSLLFSYL